MPKMFPISQPYRLATTLTKVMESNANVKRLSNTYNRGPLPWEDPGKFAGQPKKKFRKKEFTKKDKCQKQYAETCRQPAVLQKPKRTAYEWVNEEQPKKPSTFTDLIRKSVCELRRFQECMREFNNECDCKNLSPECLRRRKVYPMLEAVEKGPLPGCAKPLPPTEKSAIDKLTTKPSGKKTEEK